MSYNFISCIQIHYKCENTKKFTYKESAHPPGNEFSRALESRFLVPKNEAQCSYFHLIGHLI